MSKNLLNALKNYFLSGVLVVVPLILTYIVLKFLFETLDGILNPLIEKVLGYHITGLGIITTILIIILAGIFTRNIVGARIYRVWDSILNKVPFIRPVYSAAKQLLEAITLPSLGKGSFKEVCLAEYPRKGSFALGFLSNRLESDLDGEVKKYVSVFIPSTPTPVSGMVILLPPDEIIPLEMTVEEGIKFLVSGGVASPEMLKRKVMIESKG